MFFLSLFISMVENIALLYGYMKIPHDLFSRSFWRDLRLDDVIWESFDFIWVFLPSCVQTLYSTVSDLINVKINTPIKFLFEFLFFLIALIKKKKKMGQTGVIDQFKYFSTLFKEILKLKINCWLLTKDIWRLMASRLAERAEFRHSTSMCFSPFYLKKKIKNWNILV